MKKIIFSGVFVVISVSLSLAGVEGLLRLKNRTQDVYDIEMWRYSNTLKTRSSNPILGHEHIPSTKAVLQKVEIRINRQGLRGGPVPPVKPHQRRILVLGSSATLGWGVEEKNTLTTYLKRFFSRDGEDVVVMNAGIGNYNTVRYVERFFSKLKSTQPTDIIVHYFVNDAEVLKPGSGNFLLHNSQLAVTLWIVFNRLFTQNGLDALKTHYQAVYQPEAHGFKEMIGALKRLKHYAENHKVRLYLAMTPDIHNLQEYQLGFIHEKMKKIAYQLGFVYIDLLPSLKKVPSGKIWAMPGDPHPNRLGHEIMAKEIYPALKLQK